MRTGLDQPVVRGSVEAAVAERGPAGLGDRSVEAGHRGIGLLRVRRRAGVERVVLGLHRPALAGVPVRGGATGHLVGVDLSLRMALRSRRRLAPSELLASHALLQADARHLPLRDAAFDAVTSSFMLDLIDTDDIPTVLSECGRVLSAGGRLTLVGLDLRDPQSRMTRVYHAHTGAGRDSSTAARYHSSMSSPAVATRPCSAGRRASPAFRSAQ